MSLVSHNWLMGTFQTQEDTGWLEWTNAHERGPGSERQVVGVMHGVVWV